MTPALHPERMRTTRQYFKEMMEVYRQAVGPGAPTAQGFMMMQAYFIHHYNSDVMALPRERRPASSRISHHELTMLMRVGSYLHNGSHAHLFTSAEVDEFADSTIHKEPFMRSNFPVEVMYLYFGPQPGLNLWDSGHLVDGAYLEWWNVPGASLQITLTSHNNSYDYSKYQSMVLQPERYQYASLDLESCGTMSRALDRYIDEQRQKTHIAKTDTSGVIRLDGRDVQIVDVSNTTAALDAELDRLGAGAMRASLPLIAAGIKRVSSGHASA